MHCIAGHLSLTIMNMPPTVIGMIKTEQESCHHSIVPLLHYQKVPVAAVKQNIVDHAISIENSCDI